MSRSGGNTLSDKCNSKAYTGFYQLDLEKSSGFNDYRIKQTKFLLYETECDGCHASNRYIFQHQKTSINGLEITGYGLVGATLAGMIVYLNKSLNLPCSKVRELLHETYGIKLSKGLINQTIHEAGLCCEPLAEEIKEEVLNSALCHVDETGWKNFHQEKKHGWLWVFKSPTACYFAVGGRTKAFFKDEFAEDYDGWLVSDGYNAYRHYDRRFRCLAHLKRKAVGLSESHHDQSRLFGQTVLNLFEKLFKGVYEARSGNKVNQSIKADYEADLLLFKQACQCGLDSSYENIRQLSYEFLHDWDAIFRVLDYPAFPLTNNEAERALRHWVINRKVTLGSQSELGAMVLGILASIVSTCKVRYISIIDTLSDEIANFRFKGAKRSYRCC